MTVSLPSAVLAFEKPAGAPFLLEKKEARASEPSAVRVRVLVVDDQRIIADSLSEILNNVGFEATAAYDGMDALEIMSDFRPQWILSDVLMPRMNGVELGIEVRNQFPETGVLLFSGQAGVSEIVQEAHRRGYDFELLAKPIHPSKLIERLNER